MAIQTLSFISIILRPYVKQPISTDGWKHLFAQVDPHRNFDGELMAFGTMSGQDMDRIIHDLISFGYVGPDQGDKSDMVVHPIIVIVNQLIAVVAYFETILRHKDPQRTLKLQCPTIHNIVYVICFKACN
jgi:hypothetical protein